MRTLPAIVAALWRASARKTRMHGSSVTLALAFICLSAAAAAQRIPSRMTLPADAAGT